MISNLIDVSIIEKKILDNKVREMSMKCSLGKASKLYGTADVTNLQKNSEVIRIGDNVHCRGQLLVFSYAGSIEIGDNVFIGENSRIWSGSVDGIRIGSNVLISHNVFICDTNSHESDYSLRAESFLNMVAKGHPKVNPGVESAPVVIEDNAWISFNAIILKGVTIGKGSIIGAGAIVTKDIPPFSLVVGTEARILKKIL